MDSVVNAAKSTLNVAAESEGKKLAKEMENLKTKSIPELKELLERHNGILSKPHLVAKLPDRGEKLRRLKQRLDAELASRASPQSIDNMVNTLATVQLSEALEWNATPSSAEETAGDAPADPLFSMLQNEATKDITLDPYVEALCKKYGSTQDNFEHPQRFLPFRSTEYSPKMAGSKSPGSPGDSSSKPGGGSSPDQKLGTSANTSVGKSPKSPESFVHQLPLAEAMILQKKQAESVAKVGHKSLMSVWRERGTVGSDTDEEEEEEMEQQEAILDEEEEGDPPQIPEDDNDDKVELT